MKNRNRWDIETIDVAERKKPTQAEPKKPLCIVWLKKHRKKLIIFSIAVYILFFLLGILTTRYYTDNDGERRAYRITMTTLKRQEDYEALKQHLTDVRELFAEITIIDIHMANGEISAYEAATGYTSLLNEKLDVMIPKVSSLSLQDKQKPVQQAIAGLLSNDLALYLQKITEALKTGNSETVSTALAYREKAVSSNEIIEEALKKISEELHMGDDEYYEWKLADAVEQKDPTAILRQAEDS